MHDGVMLFNVTKSSKWGFAKYEVSSAASIANYHNMIAFAYIILVT